MYIVYIHTQISSFYRHFFGETSPIFRAGLFQKRIGLRPAVDPLPGPETERSNGHDLPSPIMCFTG